MIEKRQLSFGFTLMELLIVVAIISVIFVSVGGNWLRQIQKGYDSRRKTDLAALHKAFEEYFNDREQYPPLDVVQNCGRDDLASWGLKKIPCDPESKLPYFYEYVVDDEPRSGFRIYTILRNDSDPDIAKLNCSPTCIAGMDYNYGLSSGISVSQ